MTPATVSNISQRIAGLKADLVEQGRRVEKMVESAVDAVFERDGAKALWVIEHDNVVDRVDIEIEKGSVLLLMDIAHVAMDLSKRDLRMLFTIVKINNEMERIADCAVNIAERVPALLALPAPPTPFRVLANSVVGIVRDTTAAFERDDVALAQSVLATDDLVDEFENRLLRDVQEKLSRGGFDVEAALALHRGAADLERMGDHCTNIAEQVIYVCSGAIVRHEAGHWTSPKLPEA